MMSVKSYATRAGALMEEVADLQDQLRQVYTEAKADGITPSSLRKAVKVHFMTPDKREKHDQAQMDFELYLADIETQEATDPMQRIKEAVQ